MQGIVMIRLVLGCALLIPAPALAQTLSGRGEVVDGDSLSVGGISVRLFGIDAPEGKQTCDRNGGKWACGEESASQLRALVGTKRLDCRRLVTDTYGRTVAVCWIDELELNQAMVAGGWATAFRKYSDVYVADETRAKSAGLGIWSSTFELPETYRLAQEQRAQQRQSFATSRPGKSAPAMASSSGCVIKGNRNRKGQWIYHLPGMPYYDVTRPEEIFCSEAQAQAAGYRRAIVR
jgi:endonuclease YncB( thermonuclease family)